MYFLKWILLQIVAGWLNLLIVLLSKRTDWSHSFPGRFHHQIQGWTSTALALGEYWCDQGWGSARAGHWKRLQNRQCLRLALWRIR